MTTSKPGAESFWPSLGACEEGGRDVHPLSSWYWGSAGLCSELNTGGVALASGILHTGVKTVFTIQHLLRSKFMW